MGKRTQEEWDIFYLGLAKKYSEFSKDPSTKVGAVVTRVLNNRLVSAGYNGFPSDIEDTERNLNDREFKLANTIHAEINALSMAEGAFNKAIYVYPFRPCEDCTLTIIKDPFIKRVITTDYTPDRWKESFKKGTKMFKGLEKDTEDSFEFVTYPMTKVN